MTRALIGRQSQPRNARDQAGPNPVSRSVPPLARTSPILDPPLLAPLPSSHQDGTEGLSGFKPALQLQRKCAPCEEEEKLRRKCAHCEEEEKKLRRKETRSEPPLAPPIVHEVLSSHGQPIDDGTRSFMESRFGHDFSRVRVHASTHAAQSARAVNALAYTVGVEHCFRFTPVCARNQKGARVAGP